MDHCDLSVKKQISKPLVEKKRREKINAFLDELKVLVLTSLNKDVNDFAKMEKADILEMTVNHIKNTKPQIEKFGQYGTPLARRRYKQGFSACIHDTMRYLADCGSRSPEIEHQLAVHLNNTFSHYEHPAVPIEENILPMKLQLAQEVEHAAIRAFYVPQREREDGISHGLATKDSRWRPNMAPVEAQCEPHSTSPDTCSSSQSSPLDYRTKSRPEPTVAFGDSEVQTHNQAHLMSHNDPFMWQPWRS